ncbi:hypothetical protein L1987_53178 [Smallanthus sonchifolius]|uniref:Uncharacterized protein n=1 Tax=Smallanthus sonchifolius TaxID=185202 RepID=A0ACB9EV65_9ASTR|nr:hypothetical protein L1987_53178 [Smallanthus sonchifolius]
MNKAEDPNLVSTFFQLLDISVLFFFLLNKFRSFRSKTLLTLPPGPPGLPVIGNLHQLDTSNFLDYLWRLSKRYGPLMSLYLGNVQTLVVSSVEMAKEVLQTKDLIFCNRPLLTGPQKLSYNNKYMGFSPYNEYWRETRKTCTLHLFSMKQVNLFRPVREQEVFDMIDGIKSRVVEKDEVNLTQTLMLLTSNIISRVAFGKRTSEDHFPLMRWLDKLNGSITRLENTFKDLDEFYQELIDEHVNRSESNNMQEDMVDILLKLKQDSDCSIELTYDHIKVVLMVSDSPSIQDL